MNSFSQRLVVNNVFYKDCRFWATQRNPGWRNVCLCLARDFLLPLNAPSNRRQEPIQRLLSGVNASRPRQSSLVSAIWPCCQTPPKRWTVLWDKFSSLYWNSTLVLWQECMFLMQSLKTSKPANQQQRIKDFVLSDNT